MKRLLLLSMLVVAGAVLAEHVGTFYGCEGCPLGSLTGPDERMFINEVVNPQVDSWMTGDTPNTVDICNTSSLCGTYRYVPLSGVLQRLGPTYPAPVTGCDPRYVTCQPL